MKVNKFTVRLYNNTVSVDVECSHCGKLLDHTFIHCPMCGKKLVKIPQILSYDKVCSLINDYLHSSNSKSEHKEITPATEPVVCPRGMADARGCEFLEKDGTCSGVVYPTYPPQFDKCVFLTSLKAAIDPGLTDETSHKIPNFK